MLSGEFIASEKLIFLDEKTDEYIIKTTLKLSKNLVAAKKTFLFINFNLTLENILSSEVSKDKKAFWNRGELGRNYYIFFVFGFWLRFFTMHVF